MIYLVTRNILAHVLFCLIDDRYFPIGTPDKTLSGAAEMILHTGIN